LSASVAEPTSPDAASNADRVADFYSMEGYWHERQREKAHPTLLERRSVLERDGRVDRWIESIEAHTGTPAGSVVVEVGCAEGTLLSRLQSQGMDSLRC
jgi:hypothetical protein